MDNELDVTAAEALEDLRQALGIPDVWEHDENTWTKAQLAEELNLGRSAVDGRVEKALKAGTLVEGRVKGERGHFVRAFRLKGMNGSHNRNYQKSKS